MKARQIDITKEDIRCCDELMVETEYIEATYELWLDVDKYFGTKTRNDDSAWINFYTAWYPNGMIKAYYCLDTQSKSNFFDWRLTNEETEFFRQKMEDYCQQTYNKSLMEIWNEHNDESEVN